MVSNERLVTGLTAALGRGTAYADLADALRGLVLDGQLVVGDRLPAERNLAAALGLSRTTVTSALTVLRGEGYLQSRQGSGTVVSLPADLVERPGEAMLHGAADGEIDLTVASLPAPAPLLAATERAAARLPALLSGRGLHPLGLPDLRAALARRMTRCGLATHPDEVLVTQGALHSWDLVLRSHLRPGGRVLVEQPSYPAAMDAVLAHNGRFDLLGVDADGWRWPSGRMTAPSVAYLIPDHQNPTGHFADEAARRDVLRALRGTLVCVDEVFAELGDGIAAPSMAALDRRVVTLGSLSKLVWAGLRVGWVRAPREVIVRLAVARSHQDLAAPVLEQLVALELVDELDAIAAARRPLLRTRREHMVNLVRAAGWQVTPPRGGLSLWVDLGDVSSTHLSHSVAADGVRITPGPRFTASGTHDRFVRLPFSYPEETLTRAVDLLTHAATRRVRRSRRDTARWTV